MNPLENQTDKIKEEGKEFAQEVKQKAVGYIAAAFGLVAGLAWNDAIKALIELLFPAQSNTVLAKFIYAFLITAVVVLVTVYLLRLFKEKE